MTVVADYRILPYAIVRRTTNQSIPNATDTPVLPATKVADPWGMWEGVAHPERLTAVVPGLYLVTGLVHYDASAAGYRQIWFTVNGSVYPPSISVEPVSAAATETRLQIVALVLLALGDYIDLVTRQSAGGGLNLTFAEFAALRVPTTGNN